MSCSRALAAAARRLLKSFSLRAPKFGRIVVIDSDAERIELAKAAGVATIRGDTTRDEVQKAVHLERASSLIVSCGRDDTSILTVLTARHLAPTVRIAVAIRNSDNEAVAHQAGANVVVNPVSFTGLLLASTSHGEHIADISPIWRRPKAE